MKNIILLLMFFPCFAYAQFSVSDLEVFSSTDATEKSLILMRNNYFFNKELSEELTPFKVYINKDNGLVKLLGIHPEGGIAIYDTKDVKQGLKMLNSLNELKKRGSLNVVDEKDYKDIIDESCIRKKLNKGYYETERPVFGNSIIYVQNKKYIYVYAESGDNGSANYSFVVLGKECFLKHP